jgi:general secretion pathway protein G
VQKQRTGSGVVMGRKYNSSCGFTLVEVLMAMAIGMTVAAMAIPSVLRSIDNARVTRAMADIDALEGDIEAYDQLNDSLPNTLADIGRDTMRDPWGHPYQYLNFATVKGKGKMRKDRFLVPINSTYDLYSMGKDGMSVPPITAKVSQDDIIRANDGAYLGLASNY